MLEFTCEAIWAWTFVCLEFVCLFKLMIQFHLLIGLLMFSVSSQFSIETIVYFWEFVHFFWVAHFIGIILFIVISYNSLSFCSIDCNFFFISDFMICALFFLDESGYIGLSYMAFIMMRYFSSVPTSWRVFIINNWLSDIEKSLHPWGKSHLIMVCNLFDILLSLVCY